MPSAPTIVRSRISFSSLYEQMSTSIDGGWSSDVSHSAFASASGDRSRVRVRNINESAAVTIPTSSADEKGERKRIFEADRRRGQRLRNPPPRILSHHGETARDHEGPSCRDRFWPDRRADEEKPQRHQRRLEGCENRIVDNAKHGLQLSEIEPLRCGPVSPLPARADSPSASPKETVPVRPIEHPAAPMSSMAIVT